MSTRENDTNVGRLFEKKGTGPFWHVPCASALAAPGWDGWAVDVSNATGYWESDQTPPAEPAVLFVLKVAYSRA